jgi:hypothetical protein
MYAHSHFKWDTDPAESASPKAPAHTGIELMYAHSHFKWDTDPAES